jgi:hypothetical protein
MEWRHPVTCPHPADVTCLRTVDITGLHNVAGHVSMHCRRYVSTHCRRYVSTHCRRHVSTHFPRHVSTPVVLYESVVLYNNMATLVVISRIIYWYINDTSVIAIVTCLILANRIAWEILRHNYLISYNTSSCDYWQLNKVESIKWRSIWCTEYDMASHDLANMMSP